MKKLTLFLVVTMLMISFATSATALDEFILSPESSNIFQSYGSGIDLSSGLIISNSFSTLNYAQFQQINMDLQKYSHGSWSTVSSWQDSIFNVNLNLWKTYPANPGSYRVKATHTTAGQVVESFSRILTIN